MIKKILITTEDYYPNHGGIQQYIKYLSRFLISQGIEVYILTQNYKEKITEASIDGAKVFYSQLLIGSMSDPFSVIEKKIELSKFINKIKPDIVFANNHNSLAIIETCKLIKIPVVYGCHGVGLMCSLKKRFLKEDERLCWDGPSFLNCTACHFNVMTLRKPFSYFSRALPGIYRYNKALNILDKADARLGNSELTKTLFRKHDNNFGHPLLIDVMNKQDGFFKVDSSDFCQKYGIVDKSYILISGRVNRIKGHIYAIQALKYLNKDIKLVIAGNESLFDGDSNDTGAYGEIIKQYLVAHNLSDRVIFTGRLNINELREAYSGARITIVPSIWIETFGYITLESMACKTPVIVTENCGSAECVDSDCGVIIKRKSSAEIAHAVNKIWNDALSMGAASREKVCREYSLDVFGHKTLRVFEEVLK